VIGAASEPAVTIIVPVFNQWAATERCLRSLVASAASSRYRAEILLSDDASTDETGREWQRFAGRAWSVRYRRNEENLRFLRNVNAAASQVETRYLCVLNNDVVVPHGWLDHLVDTLDPDPSIGAVGPLFLDGQDRILECGAIVHSDGSARQLGHGALPADRRYQFVNDVDYVSAACLLLRTEVFQRHGGFDELYAPCYYEDVDLCMKLASEGLRVVVNPRVQIVHYEGTSNGASATGGLKRYQDVNRDRFFRRWREQLLRRHSSAEETTYDQMRIWRRKPAIAVHYPRTPTWDQDSGALRTWTLLVEILRHGHHVVLFSPSDMNPYLADLQELGIETVQAWWGGDRDCRHLVESYKPLAAIFTHAEMEQRFAKAYEALSPSTIRVFDTVDLAFLREMRQDWMQAGGTGEPAISPATLSAEGLAEIVSVARSDMTFVVSDFERTLLTDQLFLDAERIRVVSTVHEPDQAQRSFEDRNGFVFLGGFLHPPNVDAARWIVNEIWPLIRGHLPEASLSIYGSSMPREIRVLNDPKNGVFARGFVVNHRTAIASARVMLTPLRFGAGVKGKIGESLAVGTPVVTTTIGAEGMDEKGLALGIANTPEGLASWAVRLHESADEWTRRSELGLEVLRERFSAAANVKALFDAIGDALIYRRAASRWELTGRLLWRAAGCPGSPDDLARVHDDLLRRFEAQAALLEQYRVLLARLRDSEARLQQDLALSTAARQKLLEPLQ
jgi:GT2 family glycosyltransferase/glycosyltransferase involved in cell wall biosynthesis